MQPHPSIAPGTVLGGDFRIDAPLGAGGMGSVFRAQQLSTGKQRAVKVMHPSLVTSPDMRERFVQEARIGSMIQSDHVVEVVGAGVDQPTGVPWLAMELLHGEDLAQHVARHGRLSTDELVMVMRPVFHALSAAHQQQIVHRDIKPENIFLATAHSSTAAMVVKVLDFGIAKVAAQALGTATSAMGTPLWMAPEQTEQQAHVSPATDVWALALVVFWALTGRNYWRTAQSDTGSVPQLMREVLFEPIAPASQRARELDPSLTLPPGFDAWFARCTAREPSARFPNASAAGVELFANVLGVTAATTGVATLPSAFLPQTPPGHAAPPMTPAQPPSPSFGTITATPVATGARESNAGKIALVVGGLVVLLGVGVVTVLGIGGLYWFTASEEPPPAPAPVAAPVAAPPALPEEPTADEPSVAAPSLPTHAPAPTTNQPAPTAADTGDKPAPTATETPKPKALYSPGQKVDVLWGGSWWQGQVVAVKNDKYLVHYIGWAASWDEWVTTARLRGWTGSARTK